MSEDYQSLTKKEKDTLRLLIRGYDTKTIATKFDLSVHTINERLRNARRKMSVASSREAARLLLHYEGDQPSFYADKLLGEAERPPEPIEDISTDSGYRRDSLFVIFIAGVVIMSIILAVTVFASLAPYNSSPNENTQFNNAQVSEDADEIRKSAETWLALLDAGRWEESWNATGETFKELNTLENWVSIASEVQPAFGAVVTRNFASQKYAPAPPHGYYVITFETNFQNKPSAIETIAVERQGTGWKVVGYTVD